MEALPDQTVYRNNPAKAAIGTIIGAGLMLLGLLPLGFLINLFLFFFGLTVFITSLVALLNRKKQIVLDKEGIYLGFKVKKKAKWKHVVGVSVKEVSIEGRTMIKIKVKCRYVKNGTPIFIFHEANLEYVKASVPILRHQVAQYRGEEISEESELV